MRKALYLAGGKHMQGIVARVHSDYRLVTSCMQISRTVSIDARALSSGFGRGFSCFLPNIMFLAVFASVRIFLLEDFNFTIIQRILPRAVSNP